MPHVPGTAPGITPPRSRSRGLRLLAISIAIALLGALVIGPGPRPVTLSAERTGDAALAEALAPHLANRERVAIAYWEGGPESEVRFAAFGTDELDEFHIASVSKTFTGALLMDMTERGEVTLETTVQDILGEEAAGSQIADVTLRELASHTAGIRRDAPRNILELVLPAAPLGPEGLVRMALDSPVSGRGDFAYTNVGISLLGQLLARHAGKPYEQLVRERLLDPLALHSTTFPPVEGAERPRIVPGLTTSGQSHTPRRGVLGEAPGVYMRSSAADLAQWARSVQAGQSPGAQGLIPIAEVREGKHIGITWFLSKAGDGGTIIEHSGSMDGFTSYVGYHRESGRGIVLLSNTGGVIDPVALAILNGETVIPAPGAQA